MVKGKKAELVALKAIRHTECQRRAAVSTRGSYTSDSATHGDIQTPDPRRKWSRPPGEWAVIISRAGQSEPRPRERLYSLPR